MFHFSKKKTMEVYYDKNTEEPALKTSICTGEKVAGFIDKSSRKFREVILIRNDYELDRFCEACGVSSDELKKIV